MLKNFVELFLLQLLNDISRDQEFSTPLVFWAVWNSIKLIMANYQLILHTLFIKCLWLRPSAYPSGLKLKNGIISKTAHRIFFLFSLLIYCFKYEVIVRSSAWSFGHTDPDPSSARS